MISDTPLRDRARGRWLDILPNLGVSRDYLSGKHTACPICREGKNRFRFDDKEGRGTWICSRCSAGDGIGLVMKVNGWTYAQAAKEIENFVGKAEFRPSKPKRSVEDQRRAMSLLWRRGRPIVPDDAAAQYLRRRTGLSVFPAVLRAIDQLTYLEDGKASQHPGMLSLVVGPDGKAVNVHRTFLASSGAKAAVAEPRKLMPGELPSGSAIRFAAHEGVLGVTEGTESAFSASALFGVPCWSVINTANMSKWIVPPNVHELIIFGDNDASFAGQRAAYALAQRAAEAGAKVTVRIPPITGTDWNDIHQNNRAAA